MAEAEPSSPRIRLPRVKLPTRAGKRPAAPKSDETAATQEAPATPSAAKTTATTPASAETAASQGKSPNPNLQQRIEGLQAWMAEIERKQGRMTYFGAAALLIAVLASAAALYFGITAKSDSNAAQDDIDELTTKVDQLQRAVTKNTEDTQQTLNNTVQQLQSSITDLQRKQAQDAANIATLQSQVAAAAASAAAGAGAGAAPGTTTAPGGTKANPSVVRELTASRTSSCHSVRSWAQAAIPGLRASGAWSSVTRGIGSRKEVLECLRATASRNARRSRSRTHSRSR